jgi:hypothetical protein
VFSVRVFNDSKRFDALKGAVARLARRHHPEWRVLSNQEVLRELGLVANPGHLYLYGPWRLVDPNGQVMSLSEFHPSVGIPTALAARVRQVRVDAVRVVCVENLTPFYELVRHEEHGLAALWADIDYGGLNILAQLRDHVSPRFTPYRMDCDTLEAHVHWAHPLSAADERNLARLKHHPALTDVTQLIDFMLLRGIKLEQEAVALAFGSPTEDPPATTTRTATA